jgi:hypothetical protein
MVNTRSSGTMSTSISGAGDLTHPKELQRHRPNGPANSVSELQGMVDPHMPPVTSENETLVSQSSPSLFPLLTGYSTVSGHNREQVGMSTSTWPMPSSSHHPDYQPGDCDPVYKSYQYNQAWHGNQDDNRPLPQVSTTQNDDNVVLSEINGSQTARGVNWPGRDNFSHAQPMQMGQEVRGEIRTRLTEVIDQ